MKKNIFDFIGFNNREIIDQAVAERLENGLSKLMHIAALSRGIPLPPDFYWLNMAGDLIANGEVIPSSGDRTAVGNFRTFGRTPFNTIDLSKGFPLISAKAIKTKMPIAEILWMMSGSNNVRDLRELGGGGIWDQWADETGSIGPMYGSMWRDWPVEVDGAREGIDQLFDVFNNLISKPFSRRHVISAWNPALIPTDDSVPPKINVANGKMAIAPCHDHFQFNVTTTGVLNLKLDMRSNDIFLGAPFNLAGYAFMACAFARCLGLAPGRLFYTVGDLHLYANHVEPYLKVLENFVNTYESFRDFPTPKLIFADEPACGKTWDKMVPWEISPSDVQVEGYEPLDRVPAPVAV